jgi:acyl-CoA dehydrogenase
MSDTPPPNPAVPGSLSRVADVSGLVAVLAAHAPDADRAARFPVESLAALRQAGYLGYLVPTEYGGMGGDLAGLVETAQRFAGGCLSTAMIWAMHCQQVDVLVRHAGDRLRADLLPRIASGEVYLASVTTQETTGGHLLTAAEPLLDGDDGAHDRPLLLDRTAPVVTGGAHADGFLITMRAGQDARAQAVSLVYADRSALKIDYTGDWNPLGMRGTHSGALHLNGQVPRDNVVGEGGRFRDITADSMVPVGHLGWSACWLGCARKVFSDLVRHIGRSGRHDTSSSLVQERIARIRWDLELVSGYLGRTTQEVEAVRRAGGPLDGTAVRIHLNTLKLAASELSFSAVDRMVQLAGLALGYRADSPIPLERAFRDLRSAALNYSNDRLWTANGALTLMDRAITLL